MADTYEWPIGSGQSLEFEIHDQNENWSDAPGLYIFAYLSGGTWKAVYAGQADSLQARLPNHERLDEAVREGATHIHVMIVRQQSQREVWAQALIRHLRPPLNMQFA
ncbi:MAG: hypothetical protein PVF50_04290 [Gammaproteobacteria bacterium]